MASRIVGTPTASADSRARSISRRGAIFGSRAAKTSWASELAQARIMPATEASRVRKIAVVTAVKRRVSAVDTSRAEGGPGAQQIGGVALRVRLRDHRAADDRRRAEADDRA